MHHESNLEKQFSAALKSIARRKDLKAYVERTPELYMLLQQAASRYVTGETRQEGVAASRRLAGEGYKLSIEYIGENTTDADECVAAAAEMKALIQDLGRAGLPARVSFDLSHIGLSLDKELAYSHLMDMSAYAGTVETEIELFISMEESGKTEDILSVYTRAAATYSNIGITLQAHLNRTPQDLEALADSPRRVRIVKGAYQEPEDRAIHRSPALNERYLELVESAVRQGHHVSIATHDEAIVDEVLKYGWLSHGNAEFEMLYGIRRELGSKLKADGHSVRIYLPYGHEWYLYLCHRIAEYPPNLYRAVIDIVSKRI
ncbi:proline dehydrogenase family protein [Paenibacillus sp. YIM B09110]|uniref:proline dehydrogenase family protein n=1 Tax=Paenibacillus sp. YIM B09110 TaxID=3126102 RepID=UPI00301BAAB7